VSASHEATLALLKRARRWCVREFAKRYERNEHASHLSRKILEEANAKFALGFCDTAGWCDPAGSGGVEYLNAGDTYALTITCETEPRSARFRVESWGDCFEAWERAGKETQS